MWWPRNTKRYQRSIVINRPKIKYWLSVGAQPTKGAHKVLQKTDLIPKYPPRFGSQSMYTKKQKPAQLGTYNYASIKNLKNEKQFTRFMLQQEVAYFQKSKYLINETLRAGNLQGDDFNSSQLKYKDQDKLNQKVFNEYLKSLDGVKTEDIDSDQADFYLRKRNFQVLQKRMNENQPESQEMGFKDYKYNMYARKMKKIIQIGRTLQHYKIIKFITCNIILGMGIDQEGYLDFIKTAKDILKKHQQEHVLSKSQPPSQDRKFSFNQNSFSPQHQQEDSQAIKKDILFQKQTQLQFQRARQRSKLEAYNKKKIENPEKGKKYFRRKKQAPQYAHDLVGKYPTGFEHYQSLEEYFSRFPDRNASHYMSEIYRECTFFQFIEIMVNAKLDAASYTEHGANDTLYYSKSERSKLVNMLFDDLNQREELFQEFNKITQAYHQNGGVFSLSQCLYNFTYLEFDNPKQVLTLYLSQNRQVYGEKDKIVIPRQGTIPKIIDIEDPDQEPVNLSRLAPMNFQVPFKAYTTPNFIDRREHKIQNRRVQSKVGKYDKKNANARTKHTKFVFPWQVKKQRSALA